MKRIILILVLCLLAVLLMGSICDESGDAAPSETPNAPALTAADAAQWATLAALATETGQIKLTLTAQAAPASPGMGGTPTPFQPQP